MLKQKREEKNIKIIYFGRWAWCWVYSSEQD